MALNGWRIMWLICAFDVPTHTKKQRRAYSIFRKKLLEHGFLMLQYSVYMRHYPTFEKAKSETARLQKNIPDGGHITFFFMTDKQYGMSINHYGKQIETLPQKAEQLLLL